MHVAKIPSLSQRLAILHDAHIEGADPRTPSQRESLPIETSVGANLQRFGFGKVRPSSNIIQKFERSSSRFGTRPRTRS